MQTALIAHRNNRFPENERHTATIPAANSLRATRPDRCAEFANPVCSKTRRAVGALKKAEMTSVLNEPFVTEKSAQLFENGAQLAKMCELYGLVDKLRTGFALP